MSGLVGSITSASKEYNEIGTKSTIEGMKKANFIYGKIAIAEREQSQTQEEISQGSILETSNLAEDIRQDMENDRER